MKKGEDYILISELPAEEQKPFQKWLWGKTRPIIEDEGVNSMGCCYRLDYERWQAYHKIQEYGSECVQADDKDLMNFSDQKFNLDHMLSKIDESKIHPEIDTGDSVGEEE